MALGRRLATVVCRPEAWVNVETGEPVTGGAVTQDVGSNPPTWGFYEIVPDENDPGPTNYY